MPFIINSYSFLLLVTKVGEFDGFISDATPEKTTPVKVPKFEWDISQMGIFNEDEWKHYKEVEEWQEQEPGDYLKFEHRGYHMEKGMFFFLSMPLGQELVDCAKKNDARPLMFIPGDNNLRRHEKPGLKFIFIFILHSLYFFV